MRKRGRILAWATACLLLCLGAGELALRRLGYADLPLYRADQTLGYVPQPAQSGTFASGKRWAFNRQGMRMEQDCVPGPQSILLLGDSIVHGGTALDQSETLGAKLNLASGRQVCPLAAGSWALGNMLQAVVRHPELGDSGTIVLLTNREDYVLPSVWQSELSHPTHPPQSILLYAITKKLMTGLTAADLPPPPGTSWSPALEQFLTSYRGRLIVVIYPRRDEMGPDHPDFGPLLRQLGDRATILRPGAMSAWGPRFYKDEIHPTAQGNARLAAIIVSKL